MILGPVTIGSILFYILLSVVTGVLAKAKLGRNGFAWFLIAVFMTPLFSCLFLIICGQNPSSDKQYGKIGMQHTVDSHRELSSEDSDRKRRLFEEKVKRGG